MIFWIETLEQTQHRTVIGLWRDKDPRRIEFRGDGYQQWLHHGPMSDAQRLHDCLEGWHATVLHTGDRLAILPEHPDFAAVRELWELAL